MSKRPRDPYVMHVTVEDGASLPILHWPAPSSGPSKAPAPQGPAQDRTRSESPAASASTSSGILLLHGLSQQARFWEPVVRRTRTRPLAAMDQRCHGYATMPAEGDVSVDRCARDSIAAIDALGWAQAVIVGHSWGASVALRACASAPERVRAGILIDGGMWRLPGDRAAIVERLRPPALGIPWAELQQLIEIGSPIPWDDERRAAIADTYVIDEEGLARTRIGMERHMRVLDGLLDYDPLPDLRAASSILWPVACEPAGSALLPPDGEPDPWTLARAAAIEVAGQLPGIRMQRWHGAVHDVPLQWPSLVAGLIDTVHEAVLT